MKKITKKMMADNKNKKKKTRDVLGVDIGGTTIKAGTVRNGKLINNTEIKTGRTKKEVKRNILEAISRIMTKEVKAIGIGCPGPIDIKKGVIGNTPNIPLQGVNIINLVNKMFNLPVKLNNDALCFSLGEALYGKGKNKRIVVGITVGTGIGGGIIIDNQPFKGRGNAGEIGHQILSYRVRNNNKKDRKEKDESTKDLEYFVSAKGIMLSAKNKGLKEKTPEELSKRAKGCRKAMAVWEETGKILGKGIVNIINIVDPDIIIIGGKISESWNLFNKPMKEEINKRMLFRPCRVVKAKNRNSSILGAAALWI